MNDIFQKRLVSKESVVCALRSQSDNMVSENAHDLKSLFKLIGSLFNMKNGSTPGKYTRSRPS